MVAQISLISNRKMYSTLLDPKTSCTPCHMHDDDPSRLFPYNPFRKLPFHVGSLRPHPTNLQMRLSYLSKPDFCPACVSPEGGGIVFGAPKYPLFCDCSPGRC